MTTIIYWLDHRTSIGKERPIDGHNEPSIRLQVNLTNVSEFSSVETTYFASDGTEKAKQLWHPKVTLASLFHTNLLTNMEEEKRKKLLLAVSVYFSFISILSNDWRSSGFFPPFWFEFPLLQPTKKIDVDLLIYFLPIFQTSQLLHLQQTHSPFLLYGMILNDLYSLWMNDISSDPVSVGKNQISPVISIYHSYLALLQFFKTILQSFEDSQEQQRQQQQRFQSLLIKNYEELRASLEKKT